MKFKAIVTVLFCIIFVGIIAFLILRLEYNVPTPAHWPQDFKISTQAVTGLTRVIDSKTGDTLILYMKDSPAVQPVNVERVGGGRWVITLEKPKY